MLHYWLVKWTWVSGGILIKIKYKSSEPGHLPHHLSESWTGPLTPLVPLCLSDTVPSSNCTWCESGWIPHWRTASLHWWVKETSLSIPGSSNDYSHENNLNNFTENVKGDWINQERTFLTLVCKKLSQNPHKTAGKPGAEPLLVQLDSWCLYSRCSLQTIVAQGTNLEIAVLLSVISTSYRYRWILKQHFSTTVVVSWQQQFFPGNFKRIQEKIELSLHWSICNTCPTAFLVSPPTIDLTYSCIQPHFTVSQIPIKSFASS